jgi:UDP-N-acetyl-D-galactosamine dehydrogenase
MQAHYGIALIAQKDLKPADAVVLAVSHEAFVKGGWALAQSCLRDKRGLVVDVPAALDRTAIPAGIELWRL